MSDDMFIEGENQESTPPGPASPESPGPEPSRADGSADIESSANEAGLPEAIDLGNVVHLVPRAREDKWPDATEFLRQLLALAERGELCQLAIAFERTDDVTSFRVMTRAGTRPTRLLGELEVMRTTIATHLCPRPTVTTNP